MKLLNQQLPNISLNASNGRDLSLFDITKQRTILYIYPMTKVPGKNLPEDWDIIPGARGCTPQSCAFRDHTTELAQLNTRVYGLSSQDIAEQTAAASRLHLPFLLLSDPECKLAKALNLPLFYSQDEPSKKYYERLTLIVKSNIIQHVFYPILKSEENANDVIQYLRS